MENKIINLQNYLRPGTILYSGRDYGIEVREKEKLDKKDNDNIEYIVKINPSTLKISTSFILGLFKNSYLKYGSDMFTKKYKFEFIGLQYSNEIKEDINKGIDYLRKYGNLIL